MWHQWQEARLMFLAQLLTCCVMMSLVSLAEPCLLHVYDLMPTFCDAVCTREEWDRPLLFPFLRPLIAFLLWDALLDTALAGDGGAGGMSNQVQTLLWNSCDQVRNSS